MGKGPKRDKKTGQFVARQSFMDRISGWKNRATTKANRSCKDIGPRTKKRKTDGIVTEPLKIKTVKHGKQIARIPVDKDGYVPMSSLVERFLQVNEGDRNGKVRSPGIDRATDAKKIFKPDENGRFRPEEIVEWYLNPNEFDIEGIDDIRSAYFQSIKKLRGSTQAAQGKIAVMTPDVEIHEMVRVALDQAFTAHELNTMVKENGLIILFDEDLETPGEYNVLKNTITLRPKDAKSGTATHEAVHHLRKTDKSRKNIISATRVFGNPAEKNEELDLEESATTAETFIRLNLKYDPDYESYYVEFSKDKRKIKEFIENDRMLFLGKDGKPLRGKRAVRALEANWEDEKCKISYLKKYGWRSAREYLKTLKKG